MAAPSSHDPQTLRAAVDRGFELHESGDLDATLAHYDELLADAPTGDDPVTVESLFAARFDRAVVLTELGELADAAVGYADAAEGLPAHDPEVHHEIAMASVNQGICLTLLDEHEAALEVYAGVGERFADPTDPVTREQVTKAMVNRAVLLGALDRHEEALAAADAVLDHLGDGRDAWAEEQRAMTVQARTAALRGLGRATDDRVAPRGPR